MCIWLLVLPVIATCAVPTGEPRHRESVVYAQFTEEIAGTAVAIDMMPVPPGRSAAGGPPTTDAEVGPFWISRTEVTWDAYDAFAFGLDEPASDSAGADAVARPSKPYILMDRGFGHAGYPAISVSYHGAQSFCRWLSHKTGRRYRLPTESEWRYACQRGQIDPSALEAHAWFKGNADFRTHPVAAKRPDAAGLHDMYGNASEWCTSVDGDPLTLGGSYLDEASNLGCAARVPPSERWNDSDPQLPKSIWWLADAGFVGFRIVCDGPIPKGGDQ
ncbi:MAG: formylglycine-generating enzyme family protein [Planctomycetota bacterium]